MEVQKELFYTEGEDNLIEARKAIAAWSLPRAAARIAAAKQLRHGGLDMLKVRTRQQQGFSHKPMLYAVCAAPCRWVVSTQSPCAGAAVGKVPCRFLLRSAHRQALHWSLRKPSLASYWLKLCVLAFIAVQALDKARHTSENAAHRLSQISSEIGDDRPISGALQPPACCLVK